MEKAKKYSFDKMDEIIHRLVKYQDFAQKVKDDIETRYEINPEDYDDESKARRVYNALDVMMASIEEIYENIYDMND